MTSPVSDAYGFYDCRMTCSTWRVQRQTEAMAWRRLRLEACLEKKVRSCERRMEVLDARLRGTWKLLVALVPVMAFVMLIICSHASPSGEPFSLTEGVSVWPCEIMRFVALFLAVLFWFKAGLDLRDSEIALTEEFFLPRCRPKKMFRRLREILAKYKNPRVTPWWRLGLVLLSRMPRHYGTIT
jgi:hypothetical protein